MAKKKKKSREVGFLEGEGERTEKEGVMETYGFFFGKLMETNAYLPPICICREAERERGFFFES